jgi:hypothetical protein
MSIAARSRYLERGTLIHLICMATLYLRVSPIILNESTRRHHSVAALCERRTPWSRRLGGFTVCRQDAGATSAVIPIKTIGTGRPPLQ